MRKFRLGPAAASEPLVFGAQGPAYSSLRIHEWIVYMKEQGIRRVCCLLHGDQLKAYKEDLLAAYGKAFGLENICWAPIPDYHLCDVGLLKERILPFLKEAEEKNEPVVVHCQGGRGRAGHVLAAWLVYGRGLSVDEAVAAVKAMGRNPHEAADWGNAQPEDLYVLLEACQEGPIV
ncbi:MAG TPA: dual specificity protein phosphatase family protein [Methylomirabilota bacterium]|jgi:protein-tyrosine phosphatase|nr:dual specificity protein phosphatase family protein [Methylomirabilota bacterium]